MSNTQDYIQKQSGASAVTNAEDSIIYQDDANSRIGIGTASPGGKLHIGGTNNVVRLDSVGITANPHLWLTQNAYYNGSWNRITAGNKVAGIIMNDSTGDIDFATDTATTGTPSLTARVRICNDGKVGIGTTTANRKVEIREDAANGRIRLTNTNTTASSWHGIEFYGKDGNAGTFGGGIFREQSSDDIYINNSNSEGIVIKDSNGNVSIGNTDGAEKLDVAGAICITDGVSTPSTHGGKATIYVDTTDGDLKIRFGDGTIKTIVTD